MDRTLISILILFLNKYLAIHHTEKKTLVDILDSSNIAVIEMPEFLETSAVLLITFFDVKSISFANIFVGGHVNAGSIIHHL